MAKLLKLSIGKSNVQKEVRSWGASSLDTLEIVFDQVGHEVVTYLRSLTNEWRPPWPHAGGPKRRAHQGHWADRTHDLEQKYFYRVHRTRGRHGSVKLEVGNDSDHAIWVEMMDGFYVVTGVMNPGGPVDKQLRDALGRLGLGYRLA